MGNVVRNCRLCTEPMDSSPFSICPACIKDSEKVRSIISKKPNLSIEEISQLTEVSVIKINKLIQITLKTRQKNQPQVR